VRVVFNIALLAIRQYPLRVLTNFIAWFEIYSQYYRRFPPSSSCPSWAHSKKCLQVSVKNI